MATRNTYVATLKVDAVEGTLSGALLGATIVVDLSVTLPDDAVAAMTGRGQVVGRLVSVTTAAGANVLNQALGYLGKPHAKFSGEHVFSGDSQEIAFNWPGQASVSLQMSGLLPGGDAARCTGVVDVISSLYAVFVDNVRVSGVIDLRASETVPDSAVGVSGWLPREADNYIRGFMGTDLLADTALASRMSDLVKLRSAFTDLLVTADLQVPVAGQNSSSWMRPYVGFSRTRTELTPLGRQNLLLLSQLGFRIHLILFNSWALKHGFSANLGSTGRTPNLNERNAFARQLDSEFQFVDSLMADPATRDLAAIMPTLESSTRESGEFCLAVAKRLRASGYRGMITANCIGEAGSVSGALSGNGVLLAPSINHPDSWFSSRSDIRNSDGMTSVTADNTSTLSRMVAAPGPRGYYIWVVRTVGSSAGRGVYSDAMITALGGRRSGESSNGPGAGPTENTVWPTLTGNSKVLLYKPKYEPNQSKLTRGTLAVLIPKDRPQPEQFELHAPDGVKKPSENYFSNEENRWIIRVNAEFRAGPGEIRIVYKGGTSETFKITNTHRRQSIDPGPWKPPAVVTPPVAVPPVVVPPVVAPPSTPDVPPNSWRYIMLGGSSAVPPLRLPSLMIGMPGSRGADAANAANVVLARTAAEFASLAATPRNPGANKMLCLDLFSGGDGGGIDAAISVLRATRRVARANGWYVGAIVRPRLVFSNGTPMVSGDQARARYELGQVCDILFLSTRNYTRSDYERVASEHWRIQANVTCPIAPLFRIYSASGAGPEDIREPEIASGLLELIAGGQPCGVFAHDADVPDSVLKVLSR